MINNSDLYELYPEYNGNDAIDLQRYNIVPIEVGSSHKGKSFKITQSASSKLINKIKNSPLLFADDDDNLPETHKNKNNKKTVIGTALNAGKYTEENGIEWIFGDFLVYKEQNQDIYNTIINNKDQVGCSLEAKFTYDDDGNVYSVDQYNGTAIIKQGCQAWNTELVLASKTEESVKEDITPLPTQQVLNIDDLLKEIIGTDYNIKLSDKDNKIVELESQINELQTIVTEQKSYLEGIKNANISLYETNKKLLKNNEEE